MGEKRRETWIEKKSPGRRDEVSLSVKIESEIGMHARERRGSHTQGEKGKGFQVIAS